MTAHQPAGVALTPTIRWASVRSRESAPNTSLVWTCTGFKGDEQHAEQDTEHEQPKGGAEESGKRYEDPHRFLQRGVVRTAGLISKMDAHIGMRGMH